MWEAHKAYIRGILIKIGSRKKKERSEKINKLTEEIYRLEQEHKKYQGNHIETLQKLVRKRDGLKELIEQETTRVFNRILKERYQWGNKASRNLARCKRKNL